MRGCEDSSSDCSDSISGDNSSFYTKNSSSEENLRYEEPRTSFSPVEKRKSPREESIHLRNGLRKRNLRNRKKASNTLDEDHLEELTSWIFSRLKANEIEGIVRSNLLDSPRVKSTKDRDHQRFAKYLLCESQN